jgi:hypothetical protein
MTTANSVSTTTLPGFVAAFADAAVRAGRAIARLAPSARGTAFEPCVVGLTAGTVHRIDTRHPRRIQCLAGCVWITEDGVARDVVLGGAEQHVTAGRPGVVVQAFERSVVRID